ncbi:hypothetical protein AgCh_026191 [Apium graveolens]
MFVKSTCVHVGLLDCRASGRLRCVRVLSDLDRKNVLDSGCLEGGDVATCPGLPKVNAESVRVLSDPERRNVLDPENLDDGDAATATESEAAVMRNILKRYECISDQAINYSKSVVTFSSNTPRENRELVSQMLGVCEKQEPGNYLGMPMRIGSNKVSAFGFLQDRVQQSKVGGGLGFRSLRLFNVAMLAKQGWRLVTNGANPSYVWRSLMEAQVVLKRGCRKRIGDGRSTKIWKVPWLPCKINGCLETPMLENLHQALVQGLMTENGSNWDDEILRDLCNDRDKNLIKQIPIPTRSCDDSWLWLLEEKGMFTVKSCYQSLQGEVESTETVFWKKLWSLNLPEDAMHILFQCNFAKDVWRAASLLEVIAAENVFGTTASAMNLLTDWKQAREVGHNNDVQQELATRKSGAATMYAAENGRSFKLERSSIVVDDCVDLLKHYDEVLVIFAYRYANNAAHLLARVAYSLSDHQEWYHTAPEFASTIISKKERKKEYTGQTRNPTNSIDLNNTKLPMNI